MKLVKTSILLTLVTAILPFAQQCFGFQQVPNFDAVHKPRTAKSIILSLARNAAPGQSSETQSTISDAINEHATASASWPALKSTPNPLVGLLVTPSRISIPVGLYRQFTATGVYRDGSTRDLTQSVQWTSNRTYIAKVDASGRAHAVEGGIALIKASVGKLTASAILQGFNGAPVHLYVDNAEVNGLNGLSIFAVQPSGALSFRNQLEMGTVLPIAPILTPSERWLYLPTSDNQMESFAVNQTSWALNLLPAAQATGDGPVAVAVNQGGSSLYTANIEADNISAYTFNDSTGLLTSVPGSPFAAGHMPDAIALDPSGKHLYAANMKANTISIYSMNPRVSGALVHLKDQPLPGSMPATMAVDITGSFLYVVEDETNDIAAFRINPANGLLAPVPGSPFAAGQWPWSIAIDPSGSYAYVDAYGTILTYTIDAASGALTPIGGYQTSDMVESIAIDPTGKYLYTANWEFEPFEPGELDTLAVNPISGVLTLVQELPFNGYPGNITVAMRSWPDPSPHPGPR